MTDHLDRLKTALSDRYEILSELGAGGMATVYLARDVRHDREVALKVLRPELAAALGPERFLQEVQVTARLSHPHIVPLFDSGEADGALFYVMPYVGGESLRDRLAREGELPVAEAVRILQEVVDALAEAHKAGLVHRDIKPANILLAADFGVAKAVSAAKEGTGLTTLGVAMGTPAYMAPEQAAADSNVDHRVDLYAVGALGYELLTGRKPFTGKTPMEVLTAQATTAGTPVRVHREAVPEGLEAVIHRCLEKKPADRWQSAEELLVALESFGTPSGGVTPFSMTPGSGAKRARRPTPVWVKVATPLAVAALLVTVWLGQRETAQEDLAEAGGPEDQAVAAASEREPLVAVLPLENLTGDPSLDAVDRRAADAIVQSISQRTTVL